MTEKNNPEVITKVAEDSSENSFLTVPFFLRTFLLNWQWFIISTVLFVGVALIYLRYKPSVYQVTSKILIKDDDKTRTNNKIAAASNLGIMTNSDGFDNELELLHSVSLAEGVVRDLKLYVDYSVEGAVREITLYGNNPIVVDMDKKHLDELEGPVELEMKKNGNAMTVNGKYYTEVYKKGKDFEQKGTLPMTIKLPVGTITITRNPNVKLTTEHQFNAVISNPEAVAMRYSNSVSVSALSKTTTIASVVYNDVNVQRAKDYLKQMAVVYNRQANDDKNQIAVRTEQFINQRLEKINGELGSTDGEIETFKRKNNMFDANSIAGQAISNTDETDKQLTEIQVQIALLKSVQEFMKNSANKYQTLPSNVGLTDAAATTLIGQYNTISLNRNRLLRTASELSPNVQMLTAQLDDLTSSIENAINQSLKNCEIRKNAITQQYSKYSGKISQAPQHERFLTEIGRQQTVKSSLYIMLLQKREENSIELAATADKGRLIDDPLYAGKVSPKGSIIMLASLILGFGFPFLIFILIELLRFRIEGRQDVEKLTSCPIIADIAMANERAKTKGDIVVHENRNNQMEEIFRGMRTNLQFMLKEKENVIMFTSSTSGEGKTFTAANLAVSFALLGKKVVLVGLDIRRPRLSNLFELNNNINGITTLLVKDQVTKQDIDNEIIPSGANKNLDLLLAGPVPPNPSELVSRKTLDQIFDILREEYDYVIVDTAPVGLVTDTLQIGRIADVTVIMCRADYTERSAFGMINDFALNNKLPQVCIAINGIDMSKKKYGMAYGYGKYGKYGKYGYGKSKSSYGYSSYGYGSYGYHSYGYGSYSNSHYGNPNDDSIKK